MIAVLLAVAAAATWSVAVPLGDVVAPDGRVEQPGGVALRIEGPAVVYDEQGEPACVEVAPEVCLLPAPDRARSLRVEPAGLVVVRRSDPTVPALTAWIAWDVEVAAALRAGLPVPPAPPGGERARAAAALRTRAGITALTNWLGIAQDVVGVRAWGDPTHHLGPELPLGARPVRVYGPGLALVRISTPPGTLSRFDVRPSLDGRTLDPVPVSSTGAAPVTVRLWVPPGAHDLAIGMEGIEPAPATVRSLPLRTALTRWPFPEGAEGGTNPVEAAERAWIYAEPDRAKLLYSRLRDAPGAVGELARARLLAMATTPEEAATLVVPRADTSAEGLELLAHAALLHPDLIEPARVLDLVRGASAPDLGLVGRWMNTLGGVRPRGQAFFAMAAHDVPLGEDWGQRGLREAGLSTRWTRLGAEAPASLTDPSYLAEGPGTPRIVLYGGESATLRLPEVPRGRFPVLRLRAEGPVRVRLDDADLHAERGALDLALAPGEHTLRVERGWLVLLDPDVVTAGGTTVWESILARLPARWAVPDPAWAGELRVVAEPASPLLVRFDDGSSRTLTPLPDGTYATFPIPAGAGGVAIEGPGAASVWLRTLARQQPEQRVAPYSGSESEVLQRLSALTQTVDAAHPGARVERAVVLASLGQVQAARRDLARVTARTAVEGDELDQLWSMVTTPVPSAPVPGPRTTAAALALVAGRCDRGDTEATETCGRRGFFRSLLDPRPPFAAAATPPAPAPTDPDALTALAETTGEPWFHVAAGLAWLDDADLPRAWLALQAAGGAGRDDRLDLEARVSWSAVNFADNGAELRLVPMQAEPSGPLWSRVRDALVSPPWPIADGMVVRSEEHQVQRVSGARLVAELWCRDEEGGGRPCEATLRVDDVVTEVPVADGARGERRWTLPPGPHVVALSGPGAGRVVAARLTVDGALAPPVRERRAFVVGRGRPAEVTVAAPSLLRLRVASGAVRLGGERYGASPAPWVVPLVGRGPQTLRLEGEGEVVVEVGTLGQGPVQAPPPARPEFAPGVPDAALQAVAADLVPVEPVLRVPARGGSLWMAAAGRRDRVDGAPPWNAAAVEAAWLQARTGLRTGVAAWTHGPVPAGGVSTFGESAWAGGTVWGEASVAATSATGSFAPAGHARVEAGVRSDVPLGTSNELRLQALGRGGLWTAGTAGAVDPRAWTSWGANHPVMAQLRASVADRRWADLRTEVGADLRTNSPGGGGLVDAVGGFVQADLLLGTEWVLSGDALARWRFGDAHRAEGGWWGEARLRVARSWWAEDRQWRVWVDGGWVQDAAEVHGGVSLLFSRGRGLHDLAPAPFRTAQGLP